MKTNMGSIDQLIRVVVGILLIMPSVLGYIGLWGWIGVILVVTGIFRFCLAYLLCGLDTCNRKS